MDDEFIIDDDQFSKGLGHTDYDDIIANGINELQIAAQDAKEKLMALGLSKCKSELKKVADIGRALSIIANSALGDPADDTLSLSIDPDSVASVDELAELVQSISFKQARDDAIMQEEIDKDDNSSNKDLDDVDW